MKPSLNVYFQNKRIRRHLIVAGLINHKGDILPHKPIEVAVPKQPKRQISARKPSKIVHSYLVKEEDKRLTDAHDKIDYLSIKRIDVEKNPESNKTRRGTSKLRRSSSPKKKKHSTTRAKSAHHSLRDSKNNLIHQSTSEKLLNKDSRRVIMIYYGWQTFSDYDTSWCQSDGDEIIVSQQHCGGENLIVFKGHVKSFEKFSFEYRRHPDYPFALALYINGLIDSRISTCCEYRHKRNVPLGGKQGLFSIVDVIGAKPCRNCRYKKNVKKLRSIASVGLRSTPNYRSSFATQFLTKSRSPSPVNQKSSSSSPVVSTIKHRSPNVSRTPTPSSTEHENIPRINSANLNSPTIPMSQKSNGQNNPILLNNNAEPYSSDFEDNSDEDVPPTTSRFGRPRISDSHSTDEEDRSDSSRSSKKSNRSENNNDNHKLTNPTEKSHDSDNSPRYSTSTSEKSDGDKNQNNVYKPKILMEENDANEKPQISSTSTRRKSDRLKDEDSFFLTGSSVGKNNALNQSQQSSITAAKKSNPIRDEDHFFLSNLLGGKNNAAGHSRTSSSSTSEKSDLSSRYQTKRQFNDTKIDSTTNHRLPFSSSLQNTTEDRRLSSNSNDIISRPSITNKTQESYLSSNTRRVLTSSSEDIFENKYSSSSKNNKHDSALNDDWFMRNNKINSGDKNEINFDTNSKTKSWRKQNNNSDKEGKQMNSFRLV
ncbi:unnamed protein product [Rotaria magnacalcarata]|uniref:DUF4590 domain-containing protein n=1 Tax=Rotaria magnacalcarata TaxID=392030 RepID=A0A819A6E4_9BILA|nr:unnamed protein product [Rotaria magnacalcarata]